MRNEAGEHCPTELALELASKDHVEFLGHRLLLKKAAHRELFKCTGFGAFSLFPVYFIGFVYHLLSYSAIL